MKAGKLLTLTFGAVLAVSSIIAPYASAITFGEDLDFVDEHGVPFSTVIGGTTKVSFKRIIKGLSGSENVNVDFVYSITPGANNPAGSTDAPFSAAIEFNNVAPTYDAASGQTVAVATGEIDFAGTYYERPGDYEYIIREVSTSNDAYELDSNSYTAVVSIRNFDDGTGVYIPGGKDSLQGTVVQGMINNLTGEKEDDPTFGSNITEKGMVELYSAENGNAADSEICFEYTLNIPSQPGVTTNDMTFNIGYQTANDSNGDPIDYCDGNPTTANVGANTKIYLKHWQTAFIGQVANGANQLPVGMKYTITQAAVDGYQTSWTGSNGLGELAVHNSLTTGEQTVAAGRNEISFANSKNAAVFTGLVLGALPYVIAGIIAGIGVAVVILIKKH